VGNIAVPALGLALSVVLTVALGGSAAGQRPASEPARYCHQAPRFSLVVPPGWNLGSARRQVTPVGEFDVARWEAQGSRAFVTLRLHTASAGETLTEWAGQLGGELAWTAMGGGVVALWRTSLFEAVYERSIFFRVGADPRIIEILLVVPGIRGWMGPARHTEPQYRAVRLAFDAIVHSIVVDACP
jgi:hypothetical protein